MNSFVVPKHTVIKYLRDKKRNPRGVIVAVKLPNGDVSVHYSYCNNKLDKFNKKTALKIAVGRALTNALGGIPPRHVVNEINQFNERISKYYRILKDDLITWWNEDDFARTPLDESKIKEYRDKLVRQ